eukprot:5854917-Alexandrium_andersonii.AAC.1
MRFIKCRSRRTNIHSLSPPSAGSFTTFVFSSSARLPRRLSGALRRLARPEHGGAHRPPAPQG